MPRLPRRPRSRCLAPTNLEASAFKPEGFQVPDDHSVHDHDRIAVKDVDCAEQECDAQNEACLDQKDATRREKYLKTSQGRRLI